MSKRQDQEQRDKATAALREHYGLEPGSVVYTQVRHVSQSGMTRDVSAYLRDDTGIYNVSRLVANATGYTMSRKHEAVRMGGVGMDMGFALVYELSRVVFRDGFVCTGEQSCMANDHVNERGADRQAGYRAGRVHSDPGYALNQRWLS